VYDEKCLLCGTYWVFSSAAHRVANHACNLAAHRAAQRTAHRAVFRVTHQATNQVARRQVHSAAHRKALRATHWASSRLCDPRTFELTSQQSSVQAAERSSRRPGEGVSMMKSVYSAVRTG
jgi:hypothetical protein